MSEIVAQTKCDLIGQIQKITLTQPQLNNLDKFYERKKITNTNEFK